jgi:hypothetical protein
MRGRCGLAELRSQNLQRRCANRSVQTRGEAPSPSVASLPRPFPAQRGRGDSRPPTQTKPFSRRSHAPEFCPRRPRQKRFASGNQRGKRSAERRMPSMSTQKSAAARFFLRGAPAFRRSRLRHSPPATTPMAQPQNRVSRRRTLLSVLPAWPDCLRLSTLRADRSFCRSTGDPEPPGSGCETARGHRTRSASRSHPECALGERDSMRNM